jgi:hypothetical protein
MIALRKEVGASQSASAPSRNGISPVFQGLELGFDICPGKLYTGMEKGAGRADLNCLPKG